MEHSCDMSAWFQRLVYVAHDHNGDSGRDAATAAVASSSSTHKLSAHVMSTFFTSPISRLEKIQCHGAQENVQKPVTTAKVSVASENK